MQNIADMEIMNTGVFLNVKTLLLGVALALWLTWLWQRRHLYLFALHFPGKWGAPLIGAFHQIFHFVRK